MDPLLIVLMIPAALFLIFLIVIQIALDQADKTWNKTPTKGKRCRRRLKTAPAPIHSLEGNQP